MYTVCILKDKFSNPGKLVVRLVQWAQLLSINGCSCSKNHFDKRKQVQAAATSKAWRDSGTASFSALQFSRQKEALIAAWLQVILSLHFQTSFIYFFFFFYLSCFLFWLQCKLRLFWKTFCYLGQQKCMAFITLTPSCMINNSSYHSYKIQEVLVKDQDEIPQWIS